MFTVIIAEQEYLDKIEQYQLFLKPFLNNRDLHFCAWNRNKRAFAEMLPDLADVVGRRKEWRAIVICDEAGLEQQNPFDLVNLPAEKFAGALHGSTEKEAEALDSAEYQAFMEAEHQKRMHAFDLASENALTRLVTFFCDAPTITKEEQSSLMETDRNYAYYVVENRRKRELRAQIRNKESIETARPTEVLCVAKRTYRSDAEEFDTVWSSHTELEYSRFYDRNMYFDRMRYLVFDILPKNQRDYSFDYIRFLYATLVLGSQELPAGCLSAERVYQLECENDEEALRRLLQTYEHKMDITKEELLQKIKDIQTKKPRLLRDNEAKQIFSVQAVAPVLIDKDVHLEELYADTSQIGLSGDCPTEEEIVWNGQYKKSQKTLVKLLKQARRAIVRSARETHCRQEEDLSDVVLFNEFQLEDVQERIDQQELEMLRIGLVDLNDEEAFLNQMEEQNQQVLDKIKNRMSRNTTLIVGTLATLLFILGFMTLLYHNASHDAFDFVLNLTFVGAALGAFLVTVLVVLVALRYGLVKEYKRFNNAMHAIRGQISDAMAQYSNYMSHVYNIRRGYAVLEAAARKQNPDIGKIILYKKHICDIELAKEKVRDVFGQFMTDRVDLGTAEILPYDFDYDRPVEYAYPLPYTAGSARNIVFMQTGTQAKVPVDFVKSLTVRREELYE